jgi:hypothetical protein
LSTLQSSSQKLSDAATNATQVVGAITGPQLAELLAAFQAKQANLSSMVGDVAAANLQASTDVNSLMRLWQPLADSATNVTNAGLASFQSLLSATSDRIQATLDRTADAVNTTAAVAVGQAQQAAADASATYASEIPQITAVTNSVNALFEAEGGLIDQVNGNETALVGELRDAQNQVDQNQFGADSLNDFGAWIASFEGALGSDIQTVANTNQWQM